MLEELHEVGVLYHKACGVVVWMETQSWCVLQVLVKEKLHVFVGIIDKSER